MRTLCHLVRAVLCGALFSAAVFAAEASRKNYDIPVSDAAVALKQFSAISGRETLFAAETVRGVKTPAVKGALTAQEALDALLAGTGLIATIDVKTGAIAVRRATPVESKNDPSRRADREAADPSESPSARATRIKDGIVQLDEFDVRSTRIDGLNNKGLLQGGADAPLYHDVVSREDIERMGVTSMEELFRLIPQTSSAATGLQEPVSNSQTTGGLTASAPTMGLRGFGSAQTVILINGRALPRSSQTAGADLGRIPLAAIERVEILPYAGSAIYGAGAIGGAINIILRKEYNGQDITAYFGTSTEGGATESRVSVIDGRTFNGGKTKLTTTFSYQHREGLRANQRGYLDEALRRYGPGTTVKDNLGLSAFERFILPSFAGVPAVIAISSSAAVTADLGIPGAPGARWAVVPAGTSPTQSFLLTPSSFSATANQASLAPRYGRSIIYEPIDSYSLNAQLAHEFFKDRLSAYGEFTVSYNRKHYSFPQSVAIGLTATDPLNPFRTGVTPGFVGRAVTIYLDTPDVPDPDALYEYESARAVVGLKGKFTERWDWSADATIDYAHSTVSSNNPTNSVLELTRLSVTGAAPAATRRAIYPILADHVQYPMTAADVENYLPSIRYSGSHGLLLEGNARVTGDVFDLPAGPLRTSAVGKYQQWDFVSGQSFQGTDAFSQLMNGRSFVDTPSSADSARAIWQGAVEVSIPIIGKTWRPIPVDSFSLQGSASYEANDTSGINPSSGLPFSNKKQSHSNVIAGKLQLTRDVALRASYSEGFFPPNWGNLSAPITIGTLPGVFADPKRGGTRQGVAYNTITGGNPDLRPETAKSENYGVIFTPRFLPGFSLTVDYWKIKKIDAIIQVFVTDSIANPDIYGFLLKRAAPTPEDEAKGWLGIITDVDQRSINASQTATEGIDSRVRYSWTPASLGRLTLNGNVSFTNNFIVKASPTAPAVNTAGGRGPVRLRGNASLTWARNRWSATVTGRYVGHYSTNTTAPSPSYPGAFPFDGGRIPAYLHWDLQGTYDIAASMGRNGWRRWLSGTKITIGMQNILNEEPAFVSNGFSYYNPYDNPRQRFVYVSLKKSL